MSFASTSMNFILYTLDIGYFYLLFATSEIRAIYVVIHLDHVHNLPTKVQILLN